jgi:hypothetical protein
MTTSGKNLEVDKLKVLKALNNTYVRSSISVELKNSPRHIRWFEWTHSFIDEVTGMLIKMILKPGTREAFIIEARQSFSSGDFEILSNILAYKDNAELGKQFQSDPDVFEVYESVMQTVLCAFLWVRNRNIRELHSSVIECLERADSGILHAGIAYKDHESFLYARDTLLHALDPFVLSDDVMQIACEVIKTYGSSIGERRVVVEEAEKSLSLHQVNAYQEMREKINRHTELFLDPLSMIECKSRLDYLFCAIVLAGKNAEAADHIVIH